MNKVAVIPARGGSVRIPDKNIKSFAGMPMVAYAIRVARACGLFERIIVSTDSEKIAAIARRYGADVPFLRPSKLADDHAPLVDVVLHALDWYQGRAECDYVCCIYPTVPFLEPYYVRRGFDRMVENGAQCSLGVVAYFAPVLRGLTLGTDGMLKLQWPAHELTRSQDLPDSYYDAGQFFWAESAYLRRAKRIYSGKVAPVHLPLLVGLDINTPEEWDTAELLYKNLRSWIRWRGRRLADLPAVCSDVVLGTAQLGMPYGINNRGGILTEGGVRKLLDAVRRGGVRIFDTAQAYGRSEEVIGRYNQAHGGLDDVRFVTKLSPTVDINDAAAIRRSVERSLHRLGVSRLWVLMLHREDHLEHLDGALGATLAELKEEGKVSNIGASVYSPGYAMRAIESGLFSGIEIPANVFDRRMLRADVERRATDAGIAVFVRSIFLQGLALMEERAVPRSIPHGGLAVQTIREFCRRRNLVPREFAFDYIRCRYPVSFVVVGADNPEQAAENCALVDRLPLDPAVVADWEQAWPNDYLPLIDASRWRISRWERLKQGTLSTIGKVLER